MGHDLEEAIVGWEWGSSLWLELKVLCCVAVCLRDHRGKCIYARSCGTQPTPASCWALWVLGWFARWSSIRSGISTKIPLKPSQFSGRLCLEGACKRWIGGIGVYGYTCVSCTLRASRVFILSGA